MAEVLDFPLRQGEVLADRVRAAMIEMRDSADMIAYIQRSLPERLPHLGKIVLDSTYNAEHGLFSVYLYGDRPGMPLLFRSRCLRSCLVACAQRLCRMPVSKPTVHLPIEGFSPVYVRPFAEFQRAP